MLLDVVCCNSRQSNDFSHYFHAFTYPDRLSEVGKRVWTAAFIPGYMKWECLTAKPVEQTGCWQCESIRCSDHGGRCSISYKGVSEVEDRLHASIDLDNHGQRPSLSEGSEASVLKLQRWPVVTLNSWSSPSHNFELVLQTTNTVDVWCLECWIYHLFKNNAEYVSIWIRNVGDAWADLLWTRDCQRMGWAEDFGSFRTLHLARDTRDFHACINRRRFDVDLLALNDWRG